MARSSELVRQVTAGRRFIDENAAKIDMDRASGDYKKLFALYQGLNALSGLAEAANAKGISETEVKRLQTVFARGLTETGSYLQNLTLEKSRLTLGEASTKLATSVGIPKQPTSYVTSVLHTGSQTAEVAAFQGAAQFDIQVKRVNTTYNVSVDLAEMGATPRTMANVVSYINGKLQAQGIFTRFAVERFPAVPRTIQSAGQTITLGPGEDRFALKVNADSSETVSFSAAATQPALYLSQASGDPDPDKKAETDDSVVRQQLLKFQSAGTAPLPQPGEANATDGRVFGRTLGPEVEQVRSTQVGPDGAVYMLADISTMTNGQKIKGASDVALLKYDSAGTLVYSRTLGAAADAQGLALAVAADGKVAIAGSVTGKLTSGETMASAVTADSFVTVFSAAGEELWTQRQGATEGDEATAVAFGADGSVFVAGRTQSAFANQTQQGGWDSYLKGYTAAGAARFTTQFGTSGTDGVTGLVVDGTSVITAGAENGRGIVRRYDIPPTGAPTLAATRDIGDLQGGSIAGLAIDGTDIVIAGSTRNTALAAGTVTRAHAGGIDAFATRLTTGLTADPQDRIAYYGGAGDDKAAALAVAGGQVWITGQAGTDLPSGLGTAVGKKDGFLANLDVDLGTVDWSRRFTAADQMAVPATLAVDASGASTLDRFGLPKGKIAQLDSQTLVGATSVRAGDEFYVRNREGATPTKVTIAADDTLETLATKIRRAMGFAVNAEVISDGNVRRLQIKPYTATSTVEFLPGANGRDALESLGIDPGVAFTSRTSKGVTAPADGGGKIHGLGLNLDLSLTSKPDIKRAVDELAAALGAVRTAYRDYLAQATPKPPAGAAGATGGQASPYMQAQLANYQAALSRLTGGG